MRDRNDFYFELKVKKVDKMTKTMYTITNYNDYGNRGLNTAKAKATITNTIIKVLENANKGYDDRIEDGFCDLLENIVAMLDNHKINQYEIGDDGKHESDY